MSKQCLSHYHIETGTWTEDQLNLIDTSKTVNLTPSNTVVIYEIAHSGHILLTRSGERSGSHGHGGGHNLALNVHSGPPTLAATGPRIYVSLKFADEHLQFFPSPPFTSLQLSNVSSLDLSL